MLRFAAYARVSTEEQDSIGAQFKACNDYAIHNDATIVATESDKISGLDTRRPGYQRILDMARRGDIDGVVVWKMSRFGRDHGESIRAALELERLGIRVHSVSEPTDSPFVRDLMLLLANNDSRVISQNVTLGMRAAAAAGKWMNTAPPGYKVVRDAEGRNPHLVPDHQAPLVSQLFEAAATGRYSTKQLRDIARDIGLRSTRGAIIGRSGIYDLLTNPAYVGDVVYGRTAAGRFQAYHSVEKERWIVAPNAHPPIVDRETFAAVAQAFASHRHLQASVRGSVFLLTGLIRCGSCGSKMFGAKAGGTNFVYRCVRGENYGDCAIKSVGGQRIEVLVRAELTKVAVTQEIIELAESIAREREDARATEAEAQRRNLLRSRHSIEEERLNLGRALMGERGQLMAPDIYARLEQEKVEALRIIDRTLATLETAPSLDISAELGALVGLDWSEFDDEAWRDAAALMVETVHVRRSDRRGYPLVDVIWTPAGGVILEAVLQSVHG